MHPGQKPPPQQPYHPGPAQPAGDNTQLGAGLMIVAAIAIIVGLVSKSFVTASWDEGTESVKIGLLSGMELCDRDECRTVGWGEGRDAKGDIKAVRMIALISGFAAAGLCGLGAVMAFSRKRPPVGVLQGALGVAAFAFTFFIVRWITEGKGEVSPGPGWAGIVGIGGLILGSVVSKTMFKHLAPGGVAPAAGAYPAQGHAPPPPQGYAPPPPPPAATTACTRCGQPAQFVAQYQRWYCPSCQQYL